jgi:hypothetical protein
MSGGTEDNHNEVSDVRAEIQIEDPYESRDVLVASKGFWRSCIILRIAGFLDFVHRPVF